MQHGARSASGAGATALIQPPMLTGRVQQLMDRQSAARTRTRTRTRIQRTIMALFGTSKTRFPSTAAVLASTATLAALALGNYLAARRAERRHPPQGAFMEVDGVRLHYSD